MDRRKLLRGTLSAPLVMTVTPVVGAARTTFMACFENAPDRPAASIAPLAGVQQDEWLRVDLQVFEMRLPNAKGELVAEAGKYFVGPDHVSVFRLADVRPESSPAALVQTFNAHTLGLQKREVERRRALAYVDRDGAVVGYAWQPSGGTHITASCYASVMGHGENPRRI